MTRDLEARIAGLPCWRGNVRLEPLHGGLSNAAFVVHDGTERYVARCGGDNGELSRYVALADALEAQQVPLPIVFGHHDLLPGNFLDDGRRLWLIDWEYGGFGTAMFDLANLAANGSFTLADERLLLETYFGQPVGDEVQRAFDAMKVASALREAAWAMVSAIHLAVPGADYSAHAADYLARTGAALARYTERHGRPVAPS
jgi:thiamine kinase-like enzyme